MRIKAHGKLCYFYWDRTQKKSDEKTLHKEGNRLVEFTDDNGLSILNGNIDWSEESQWIYLEPIKEPGIECVI